MYRSIVVLAIAVAFANPAFAATTSVPIVISTPTPPLPGNACIADGVGANQETRSSTGDVVLTGGIHGVNAVRCPDPAFPILASVEVLPPDEVRKIPSRQCISAQAKVGDEVDIRYYGHATVVAVGESTRRCPYGMMAQVVATALLRPTTTSSAPAAAPAYEPTEDDIRHEYNRLLAMREPETRYHVRELVFASRDDAVDALAQLRSGRAFATLAAEAVLKRGATDRTGDLGWNVASAFDPAFAKSVASLAPAGLSREPVRTATGWHIIEVLDTRFGRDVFPPLSIVGTRIVDRLKKLEGMAGRNTPVPAKAVCRNMVAPAAPAGASGPVTGTVTAEFRVVDGRVTDILKLTGPAELQGVVTQALKGYDCDRIDRPAIAVHSFVF